MSGARVAARAALVVSVTTLVVAVIGFVTVLVLNAFVLDRYNAYGEVPVPGSAGLHLPAGDVTVSFHTRVIGSPGGGGLPLPRLGMAIDPPAGAPEPVVTEHLGSTTTVNNDSRRQVWQMQVPADGTYRIRTEGQVSGFISPRLAFGYRSPHGSLVWVFAGLFVAGLVALAGSLIWRARTPRPVSSFASTPVIVPSPLSPTPAPYTPTDEGIRVEQLKTLAALRDCGALTEAEFETEKRRILEGR